MPNKTDAEKAARRAAIQDATKGAIETPLRVMEAALASMDVIEAMVAHGQPSSITDAGVGAACARTAVLGAALNVQVNVADLEDAAFKASALARAASMLAEAERREAAILAVVRAKLGM
jgi:glutamate formiminotransferase/formiminotetrahydrofolate cyclodeaminase